MQILNQKLLKMRKFALNMFNNNIKIKDFFKKKSSNFFRKNPQFCV